VETNDRRIVEHLSDYFAPYLAKPSTPDFTVSALQMPEPDLGLAFVDWPRDPGKTGRKDSYADLPDGRVVRKARTGMQSLLGRDVCMTFGPCLDNLNQAVNFVIARLLAKKVHDGWTICHAAAVTSGPKGLAIAGIAGAGKSTLSLHLMATGVDFVSNDRLLVKAREGGCAMAGVPKQPRVNPGTVLTTPNLGEVIPASRRQQLKGLPKAELWELEEKYDILIEHIYGPERQKLRAPLDTFLILDWHRDAAEPTAFRDVELAERPDLLEAVMKPAGVFYVEADGTPAPPRRPDATEYLRQLADVRIVEATGRAEFDVAVEFCRDLLRD
jgi:HprK-related kinase B